MKPIFLFPIFLLIGFTVKAQDIIFADDFETGVFGPNWVVSSGAPNGVVDIANLVGFDGTKGVRMGKASSAGGFTTNTLDLHLDLSGQSQVAMTFKINDRGDDTQAEDGLYFSDDNGEFFKKVLDFKTSDWCNQYGAFPPIDVDALATLHDLSLTDQFVIRFQQHGDAALPSNTSANDGIYIDDVNVYVPVLTYVSLPFSDDFEVLTFGSAWTWSFADQTNTLATIPTRPSNIVDIATGVGFNNSRGVRMGRACSDGSATSNGFATNALDLHLDLSEETEVEMTFKINDRGDDTQADDALYFSDDGGNSFEKVLEFKTSDWCNQYGAFPPIDVDALAALHGLSLTDQFVIRFQQHGDAALPSNTSANDGIYIDDVNVYVPVLTYASLPFSDDFEVLTFGSAWTWSFADQTNTLATIPTRPSNIVDIATGVGFNNSRGVRMGKACSDGPSTNALDLHLDLSEETEVEMTFKINDRGDDTQVDDALYFSDDGGITFEKVLDFKTSDWCNQYGAFPPIDVDALAALHGLSLTDQFVIRFQQHGDAALPSNSGTNDGIYIDDVNVYVPVLTYASLPFSDDFEVLTFGSAWTWSFADQTNTLATIPTRPSNIVDIATGVGFNNSRGVRMGKACSDGPSTNALDLHLDLSEVTEVAMTFKINDRGDDTQVDDAIYFSNDGGNSFQKVFEFDFSNTNNVYTDYAIDIDSLAAANNLILTSQFIVRFQQHGDDALPNNTGINNGIYIDEVNISGVTVGTHEWRTELGIRIYPNPTDGSLNVILLNDFRMGEYLYNIRNLLGEILLSGQIEGLHETVDVGQLIPGLYILEVKGKKGSTSRQFLKI